MKQNCTVHTGWSKNNRLLSNPHMHTIQYWPNQLLLSGIFRDTLRITWVRTLLLIVYSFCTDNCLLEKEHYWRPISHLILNNLTNWSMECFKAQVMCTVLIHFKGLSQSDLFSLMCSFTMLKDLWETYADASGGKDVRGIKRWGASHLEDRSCTVMNGQDVCDVVSG